VTFGEFWAWYGALSGSAIFVSLFLFNYDQRLFGRRDPFEGLMVALACALFPIFSIPGFALWLVCQLPIYAGKLARLMRENKIAKRERLKKQQAEVDREIRALDELMAREVLEKGPVMAEWDRRLEVRRLRA
jgi:hypothetical protein